MSKLQMQTDSVAVVAVVVFPFRKRSFEMSLWKSGKKKKRKEKYYEKIPLFSSFGR